MIARCLLDRVNGVLACTFTAQQMSVFKPRQSQLSILWMTVRLNFVHFLKIFM